MIAKKGNIRAKKHSEKIMKAVEILNNLGNNISVEDLKKSIELITKKEIK